MKTGIYKITNIKNNKCYIGSSKNIEDRIRRHFRELKKGTHKNSHLQSSFNKYGKQAFKWEILEICSYNNLYEIEQKYLDTLDFNKNYNQTKIAKAGGFDCMQIAVCLIDLKGNLIKVFPSISECIRYTTNNKRSTYNTSTINTETVYKRKYRLVTPEFYVCNKHIINNWKSYTNESREKSKLYNLKRVKVYNDEKEYTFKTLKEVGNFLSISRERVRQILLTKNKFHKSSGFYLKKFNLTDCNNVKKK